MAQPLLNATTSEQQRTIRQLCAQLSFFQDHPPVTIRPLADGHSNHNFYLATARGEYILRRYATQFGVCRQQEFRCQQAAAAKGLAPAPLLLHHHEQVLLSEFIPEGVPLALDATRIPVLARTLASLHDLKVQTPVMGVESYINQLATALDGEPTVHGEVMQALQGCARSLNDLAGDQVLCHFDLHPGNLLWAEQRLWLLDFEYAQLADNSFDLAAVILHFSLDAAAQQQLIDHYQKARHYDEPAVAINRAQSLQQRLYLAKCLYSGFCWLWYQAVPGQQKASAEWLSILQQLLKPSPNL